MDISKIPDYTLDGIRNYVEAKVPPGDFLYAVLTNNLKDSFGRADDDQRAALFDIVSYCWNRIPPRCWGSPERVRDWLESK